MDFIYLFIIIIIIFKCCIWIIEYDFSNCSAMHLWYTIVHLFERNLLKSRISFPDRCFNTNNCYIWTLSHFRHNLKLKSKVYYYCHRSESSYFSFYSASIYTSTSLNIKDRSGSLHLKFHLFRHSLTSAIWIFNISTWNSATTSKNTSSRLNSIK